MILSFRCVSGAVVSSSWFNLGAMFIVRTNGVFVGMSRKASDARRWVSSEIVKHGGLPGGAL